MLGKEQADALFREFDLINSNERPYTADIECAILCLEKQIEVYEACQRELPTLALSLRSQLAYLKSLL